HDAKGCVFTSLTLSDSKGKKEFLVTAKNGNLKYVQLLNNTEDVTKQTKVFSEVKELAIGGMTDVNSLINVSKMSNKNERSNRFILVSDLNKNLNMFDISLGADGETLVIEKTKETSTITMDDIGYDINVANLGNNRTFLK